MPPLTSSHIVHPGEALTVTADALSSGSLVRFPDAIGGGDPQPPQAIPASSSISVGPFNRTRRYGVFSDNGLLAAAVAVPDGVNVVDPGTQVISASGEIIQLGSTPRWVKVASILHTAFQVAATTKALPIFTLPAGADIHMTKMKHSQSFLGGAISAYTVSIGPQGGSAAKYATAFDVFQAPGAAVLSLQHLVGTESQAADTVIVANATSTTANLSASTQGSMDIWALISKAG